MDQLLQLMPQAILQVRNVANSGARRTGCNALWGSGNLSNTVQNRCLGLSRLRGSDLSLSLDLSGLSCIRYIPISSSAMSICTDGTSILRMIQQILYEHNHQHEGLRWLSTSAVLLRVKVRFWRRHLLHHGTACSKLQRIQKQPCLSFHQCEYLVRLNVFFISFQLYMYVYVYSIYINETGIQLVQNLCTLLSHVLLLGIWDMTWHGWAAKILATSLCTRWSPNRRSILGAAILHCGDGAHEAHEAHDKTDW